MISEKIEQLMKEHPDIFPTEASFWSFLRGCLRRGIWEKSPMKFKFKNSNVNKPPSDYTGRGKKGAFCALTGEWEMTSKLEVDHVKGHIPLKCEEDIVPFIEHLLASGDQLQLVSKGAHKVKSYAERMGISFNEALVAKQVIGFKKNDLDSMIQILSGLGVSPDKHTKKSCTEAYENHLKQEIKHET